MALGPGTRLGAYEILTLPGSGGTREVYRAKDTKLNRDVALKILPSADPELRTRFEREAKAIAALGTTTRALLDKIKAYGLEQLLSP